MKALLKWSVLLCLLIVPLVTNAVKAQDKVITDDDVNAIASKLYCPVCENIPLDTCGTAACKDWRYEIRLQLEDGKTEQQIIDDFVVRFGDRVVGTPQDPVLRAISLATPWIAFIIVALGGIYAFLQWRKRSAVVAITSEEPDAPLDDYHAILEQDLAEE